MSYSAIESVPNYYFFPTFSDCIFQKIVLDTRIYYKLKIYLLLIFNRYSSAIHELILRLMKVNVAERPFIDNVLDIVEENYRKFQNQV